MATKRKPQELPGGWTRDRLERLASLLNLGGVDQLLDAGAGVDDDGVLSVEVMGSPLQFRAEDVDSPAQDVDGS